MLASDTSFSKKACRANLSCIMHHGLTSDDCSYMYVAEDKIQGVT